LFAKAGPDGPRHIGSRVIAQSRLAAEYSDYLIVFENQGLARLAVQERLVSEVERDRLE
jgi:hypothetical protein